VNPAHCKILGGHCNHWGLTDPQHAMTHAVARRIDEVYQQDVIRGGNPIGQGDSSIAEDGPAYERLLADEGYALVPLVRA
jgi:hypothetical protein